MKTLSKKELRLQLGLACHAASVAANAYLNNLPSGGPQLPMFGLTEVRLTIGRLLWDIRKVHGKTLASKLPMANKLLFAQLSLRTFNVSEVRRHYESALEAVTFLQDRFIQTTESEFDFPRSKVEQLLLLLKAWFQLSLGELGKVMFPDSPLVR